VHAKVNLTVMSTALNYNRQHELTENFILSNERLTCCLNTMLKEENYTHTHSLYWKNGELMLLATSHAAVPNMLCHLNQRPFLHTNICWFWISARKSLWSQKWRGWHGWNGRRKAENERTCNEWGGDWCSAELLITFYVSEIQSS